MWLDLVIYDRHFSNLFFPSMLPRFFFYKTNLLRRLPTYVKKIVEKKKKKKKKRKKGQAPTSAPSQSVGRLQFGTGQGGAYSRYRKEPTRFRNVQRTAP
jgi:hypothetical protein